MVGRASQVAPVWPATARRGAGALAACAAGTRWPRDSRRRWAARTWWRAVPRNAAMRRHGDDERDRRQDPPDDQARDHDRAPPRTPRTIRRRAAAEVVAAFAPAPDNAR